MAAPVPMSATPVDPAAAGFNQQPGGVQAYSQSTSTAEFFLSNYRLGKTLGIGSFGKVKVAEHVLTGHKVAIKILNRRKIQQMEMEEKVRREIKILRLFMHPHIIRLYEVIETPSDIYVVMEYVKTGELFDYIVEKGRLAEDEARHFFQQIISGVEYCHRNMVVHRDLKPENLLLDSKMNVKIADFGLSNIMRDGHFLKTSCGSPNYAAPEVISGKLYAGPEVDVWSCGVILYALLCGSLPFDDENIPNLFKKIKGGIYNLPSHLSPGARDLIPRMLLVDPLKRITIPEIRQHPWFNMHLPRYLAVMQAEPVVGVPRVDEEMVAEVMRLGFEREALLEALRSRTANKASVTYYLLADNRRKLPSSGYLSADMAEGSTGAAMAAAGMHLPPGSTFGATAAAAGAHAAAAAAAAAGTPQQRLVAERRWRLGVHARGHPSALMAELYRVLQLNQVCWKKTAPYALKCRATVRRPSCDGMLTPTGSLSMGGGGGGAGLAGGATRMSDDLDDHLDLDGTTPPQHQQQHQQQQHQLLHPHPAQQHHRMHPLHQQHHLLGAAVAAQQAAAQRGGSGGGAQAVGPLVGLGGHGSGGGATGSRAVVNDAASLENSRFFVMRFECQMYKVRDDEYVIDIQRVDGELFLFMDVCGRVLSDLRI